MPMTTPQANGGTASIVIAPNNSDFKSRADVVLTGTSDHVRINQILANEIPQRGAKVKLLAGEFSLTDEIVIAQSNTSIEGEGWGFWDGFLFSTTNPAFAPGTTNPDGGLEGFGFTKLKQTVSGKNIIRIDNITNAASDQRIHGISISGMYLFGKDYTGIGVSCNDGNPYDTDQLILERLFVQRTRTGFDLFCDCPHILTNTIMDIGGRGIICRGNVFGTVWNNVIADNGDADGGEGICQLGGEDLSIVGNTFARVRRAVSTTGSARTKVVGNKSIDARDIAFYINSSDCTVHDNTSNISGKQGFDCGGGASRSTLTENKAFFAGDHAFSVGNSRHVKLNNNHAVISTYCGFYITGDCAGSSISGNTAITNSADAIVLDSPNVHCKDNSIEITVAGVGGINVLQAACQVSGNQIGSSITSNAQKAIKTSGGALTSLTATYNRSDGIGAGSFTSAYDLPTDGAGSGKVINLRNV